jgi:hypothetical protein
MLLISAITIMMIFFISISSAESKYVLIEDRLIFTQVLQPKFEVINQMASYAVQRAYHYLINYDKIQQQLKIEDLQRTAIY